MDNKYHYFNDTYNARHKSPSEVARDFIPPPEFWQLLQTNNCILVGPRGSGKTTFLKMLQPQALKAWSEREDYNSGGKPMVGVFVAADVRWAKQLELITKNIESGTVRDIVHEASFVNFLGLSLIEALERAVACGLVSSDHIRDGRIERSVETQLSLSLSEIFLNKKNQPSFSSFKHSLRVRQAEMPRICLKLSGGQLYSEVEIDYPFLGIGWIDVITSSVETINEILNLEDQKWSVLIDELEIVPTGLLNKILQPLRSTIGNILFKYALSPTGAGSKILSSHDESDPTQGNDYSAIPLWHNNKDHTRIFSNKLFHKALIDRGVIHGEGSLIDFLGVSGVEEEDGVSDLKNKHEITIENRKKIFFSLAKKDSSFKKFLEDKYIDIARLDTSDSSATGTLVRKITPLVNLRDHVLKEWVSEKRVKKRSKISLQPYLKFPNLLSLTEGNPRWILNLAECLAYEARSQGKDVSFQGVQRRAVESFFSRFISMLEVYPIGSNGSDAAYTLYAFLTKLSDLLHAKTLLDKFSPDPALSYVVDKASAEKYGDIILLCIHLGALVLVDVSSDKGSTFVSGKDGLVNRRLRICHRLSPKFFLPLRAGRSIMMISAFSAANKKTKIDLVSETKEEINSFLDSPQMDLFK